jgi:hypothetical protein
VRHLLFQCATTRDLWRELGILDVIDEALNIDLSGSAILEFLLRAQAKALPGFDIGEKETIGVACWYLWWIRRQRTHDELAPPPLSAKCRSYQSLQMLRR